MPGTYARRHRNYYRTLGWLNQRQLNPKYNRALAFFNSVKGYKKHFKKLLTGGAFLGGAVERATEQFKTEIPDLNTRDFVTWSEGTMPRQSRSGLGGTGPPADRQYAAVYRNHSSTFGHKKRYSLRRIKRELRANDCTIKSRFHCFQNDGFQDGFGGKEIAHLAPSSTTSYGLLPFLLYDVTSLPGAVDSYKANRASIPIRQYQLTYTTDNVAGKTVSQYGWLPRDTMQGSCSHMLGKNNLALDSKAAAVITEEQGRCPITGVFNKNPVAGGVSLNYPYAAGFKHDWSSIEMVMYPQNNLPVKWHVALVSFPDSLTQDNGSSALTTAGPGLRTIDMQGDVISITDVITDSETYDIRRLGQWAVQDINNLDHRWEKFWSGKLYNPINRDTTGAGTFNPVDNRLPFKIIEHESFMQPARNAPEFPSAQRLIKKLFYRRGWEFKPSRENDFDRNAGAMSNYDEVQLRHDVDGKASSPFPSPSEIVYLAIWTEAFTTGSNPTAQSAQIGHADYPTNELRPSFDLVVKMQHTISDRNNSIPTLVPAPQTEVARDAMDEPEPQPADAPVKKKRLSKKLNAPSSEQGGTIETLA